jgi:hypothetical protein
MHTRWEKRVGVCRCIRFVITWGTVEEFLVGAVLLFLWGMTGRQGDDTHSLYIVHEVWGCEGKVA